MNYDFEIEKMYHPENFKSQEELELTDEEIRQLELLQQESQEYNYE